VQRNAKISTLDCASTLIMQKTLVFLNAYFPHGQGEELGSKLLRVEIEVVCSDLALHRERVESRTSDIDRLTPPTWKEVLNRHYEPWDRDHLVLDSAIGSVDHLLEEVETYVRVRTV
jgi:hypothetical protein